MHKNIRLRDREYVYIVAVYQKYLTKLVGLIIFEPWRENYRFSLPKCVYCIYLSTSDLLSFIMFNTNNHECRSIWRWIMCCNDVMNNVDCVIKRDTYPQKMHSCSKNIDGISVFVLKYPLYIKKYIIGVNAWLFC